MSLETLPSATTASIGAIPLSAISTTGAITGDIMQFNGSAWGPTGTTLSITDNLMKLGLGNVTTDVTDLGIYFPYNSSGVKYGAMFRDATDGTFNVVDRLTSEPTSTVTLGNTYAKFSASDFKMYNYTDATKSATLSVDSSNNLSLTPAISGNILIPADKQLLVGTTSTTILGTTPVAFFVKDATTPMGIAVLNTNFTSSGADCRLIVGVADVSAGDPYVIVQAASSGYGIGLDNDQSDRFQICYGGPPVMGTNVLLSSSTTGDWGMGLSATQASNARLELLKTTEQLRLTHTHNTKYVSFTVDTNENLTIDPTNAGAVIVNSALTASGALTASTTLGVTGATTLSSTLGVTGATTLSSTLGVTGATTLSSTLGVTGATTLLSTLDVTGATTLSSTAQILRLGLGGAADGTAQLMITSGGDVKFTVANGDLTITPSGSDITLNTAKIGMTSSGTNTGIGYLALGASTGLSNNTAVGTSALAALNIASGAFNTGVGSSAGTAITTGTNNTMIGNSAGRLVTTGSFNVAVGGSTLSQLNSGTTSSNNVAIGHASLGGLVEDVHHNVCIGKSSGVGLLTGGSNIVIGSEAGALANTTGSNNILIGRSCNFDATGMANTIKIGFGTPSYTVCKIEGIGGASMTGISALVGIDNSGVLGTVGASSILYTGSMIQITKASEQLRLVNNGAVDAKFTVDGSGVLTVAPSGSTAITGALAVSTTLGVTGATTLSSTAQILRLGLGGAADATAQLKLTNTGNVTFTCDTNGDLTIKPSGADTNLIGNLIVKTADELKSATLSVTSTGYFKIPGTLCVGGATTGHAAWAVNFLSGAEAQAFMMFGNANSTGNQAEFGYVHVGTGSTSNRTYMGFFATPDVFTVFPDYRATLGYGASTRPTAVLDITARGNAMAQLRLMFNATLNNDCNFTVASGGGLTIAPGGATTAITGALTVSTTLGVTGATTLSSTLGVTGATTLSSTLGVTGATTLSSTLGVTGATTLSSTLGVTGATTLSSTLGVTGAINASDHVNITTAGKTLTVKTGSNACAGTGAVLSGGTITVNTTAVLTGDIILLNRTAVGGTTGDISTSISNATSFTITSSSGTDASTFSWVIVRPVA